MKFFVVRMIRALSPRNSPLDVRFLGFKLMVYSILGFGLAVTSSCSDQLNSLHVIEAVADGEPITPKIAENLRKDFKKKLKRELSDLKKKHKQSRKEASVERKTLYQQWNQQEKKARHAFFEANLKGSDRRAYVKDFIARRDQMLIQGKEEEKRLQEEQKKEFEEFTKSQAERLSLFEESLSKNLMPPKTLWGEP